MLGKMMRALVRVVQRVFSGPKTPEQRIEDIKREAEAEAARQATGRED
jgi:hypothetical protein